MVAHVYYIPISFLLLCMSSNYKLWRKNPWLRVQSMWVKYSVKNKNMWSVSIMLPCQCSNIPCSIGVFPKWKGNAVNSENLINHWSIKWGQYRNPVYYLCLTGLVVASRYLTQKVASFNNLFQFWEHLGKTQIDPEISMVLNTLPAMWYVCVSGIRK